MSLEILLALVGPAVCAMWAAREIGAAEKRDR